VIDRWVYYAGWSDKYAQVFGSVNPVAGPYYNFTVPEPTGVVAVVAPEEPALLGLDDASRSQSPYAIFDFQEMKTVWHPVGM